MEKRKKKYETPQIIILILFEIYPDISALKLKQLDMWLSIHYNKSSMYISLPLIYEYIEDLKKLDLN